MQLSVIIVNYNVKYFLEQCLFSVRKAARNLQVEIFVVDNNSSDGSRSFFSGKFGGVRFIWSDENSGFAKANNFALKQATGEYILFLNPDTIVPEDCLEKCIAFFGSHPEAGALGVKMLDGSGKFLKESKRSFPSPLTSLYKLSGLSKIFPHSKIFSKYHLGHLDKDQNNEVDVLAGAFLMVPRKVIEAVGSFDEDFFMYGEDIDLSYRIRKAGYKNYYFAETGILHFKGESTRKGSLNYVRLFYKAMSVFAKKHYGSGKAGIFNFLVQVGIFFRAVISSLARFMKWIGIPVIDAATILMSFWLVKVIWNYYVKKDVNYSPNLLLIAFPVFTLIFLVASYYSGLYDNGFKQKRLNHSVITAFLILLSCYALLPESFRFSRGILVFGSLLTFLLMTVIRKLLVKYKVIEGSSRSGEHPQTILLGDPRVFPEVNNLMQNAGMPGRIVGRIDVSRNEGEAFKNIAEYNQLLSTYPVREVIFCEGELSFKEIIGLAIEMPRNIKSKFHASGSVSIVGSDSKDAAGTIISHDKRFLLYFPVSRRNKNFVAVVASLFFIITFPVHLLFQKKPLRFFRNVFDVLFLRITWVGYAAGGNKSLPVLKNGVVTTTGLPASLNILSAESLRAFDELYAEDYTVWQDVRILWRSYKYLSA